MKFLASLELLRPSVLDLSLIGSGSYEFSPQHLVALSCNQGIKELEGGEPEIPSNSWSHKQWEATLSPSLKHPCI